MKTYQYTVMTEDMDEDEFARWSDTAWAAGVTSTGDQGDGREHWTVTADSREAAEIIMDAACDGWSVEYRADEPVGSSSSAGTPVEMCACGRQSVSNRDLGRPACELCRAEARSNRHVWALYAGTEREPRGSVGDYPTKAAAEQAAAGQRGPYRIIRETMSGRRWLAWQARGFKPRGWLSLDEAGLSDDALALLVVPR